MPDLDGALHHPSHELAAATSVYTFSHASAIIMSPKRNGSSTPRCDLHPGSGSKNLGASVGGENMLEPSCILSAVLENA